MFHPRPSSRWDEYISSPNHQPLRSWLISGRRFATRASASQTQHVPLARFSFRSGQRLRGVGALLHGAVGRRTGLENPRVRHRLRATG